MIPYVDESVLERDFKYYIFDWDDNILRMPTRIRMERKQEDGSWVAHPVSTAVFSIIRRDEQNYRPLGGSWEAAFADFQDNPDTGGDHFLHDTELAIERILSGEDKPLPSFDVFREMLVEGRLFAIVTARGHDSATLQEGVRLFIKRVLTDEERKRMLSALRGYRRCFDGQETYGTDEEELNYFLSLCKYHAVTSPAFRSRMGVQLSGGAEASKQFAVNDFVEHVIHILERTGAAKLSRSISVGFSDDDSGNVVAVENYIANELARRFPWVKFCIYDTSAASGGMRKVVVTGQMELGLEK